MKIKEQTERLDKIISKQLNVSRSEARIKIRHNKVKVNGAVVRDPSERVAVSSNITCNDESVEYKEHIYLVMNKPAGILTACNDKNRKTIVDIIPEKYKRSGMFPVGRLDKDTTGLIILTDDGDFGHRVISPKSNIAKSYIATLDSPVTKSMIKGFANGVKLVDGTVLKPAKLFDLGDNKARVIITEGKYHQIKRMFGLYDAGVNELMRESIGGLVLPADLEAGQCIEYKKEELERIMLEKK